MKNRILFAALAALTLVTSAWASGPSVPIHQKFDQLRFITSAAANPNGGVVDSVAARRVGAAGASSVLDTTQAISTEGWLFPSSYPLLADTTGHVFTLMAYASLTGGDDGCESGADSLAVAVQVSADGVTWATAAAVVGQTASAGTNPITSRNNQTIVNGAFMDRLSLNGAALANGQPIWFWEFNHGTKSIATIDRANIVSWPYLRFIFSMHKAKGYKIQAKISRMAAID